MTAGRNDPCPCGSGKKYKKCHGAQGLSLAGTPPRPGVARANALKAADIELGKRLLSFAKTHFGAGWLADAIDSYVELGGGEINELETPLAIPWVLYFMANDAEGLTLADAWRRERATRVSPDERLLLDAYAASWLSIWEVTGVERGVGATLVDLLTREERFVHDVRSSETLERFDTVLAFVLDCDDVSFFGGVHGQPLPPREADDVVYEARRICRVRTRPVSADKLRDNEIQLDLVSLWNLAADQMYMKPPPVLTNTDGDLVVMTTDDFELLASREEVARRLESMKGAEAPEQDGDDVVFAITKPGNAQHRTWDNTVIARIVVTERRLRVETNSRRRADVMRAAVETHLERMVRFRLRSEANTDGWMEKARASVPVVREPQPPEAMAAMREFRERHMTAWLDDSIPALNGLTPREAARLPRARPKLDLLLKEFEHNEARLPAAERTDIGRLRVELGLAARD